MGKHKPTFQPHIDCGDFVVVVNTRQAVLTGSKMQTKVYQWHTQYPGGLRSLTARQMSERAPDRLIEIAVKGMLPPTRLRAVRMRRLRLFSDAEHVHSRQTAASVRYAPQYLADFAPKVFSPPEKAVTGVLVKDVFEGEVSEKRLEELAKTLTPQSATDSAAELDAELARLAAEQAAEASRRAAAKGGAAGRLR